MELKKFSFEIRKKILELSLTAGSSSSHFGGALSSVEIVSTLFGKIMNYNKDNYLLEDRDRFILSKGHACMVYYSVLNCIGIIDDQKFSTFGKDSTDLPGHPVKNPKLGIDFSTGSLGMGLGIGIGVAIALKKKKLNNNVYVLMGDGECNEGSVWEAALAAPNLKLDNLTVIIDHNNFQQTGSNNKIMDLGSLANKWSSFKWSTFEVDGHDEIELEKVLSIKENHKPKAIIANTIKGKGFSFSENNNDWHHKVMTKKNYDEALNELIKYD